MESWASSLDLSTIDWPLAIFVCLDFDGVLHPESFDATPFCYLPLFESVLRENPEAGVVLTTPWRMDHDFARLREIFSPDLRHRIVGAAPLLELGLGDGGRFLEISAFFEKNWLEGSPFVIVDDDPRLFPEDCPELLLTDSSGMTDIDAKRLSNMIKRELDPFAPEKTERMPKERSVPESAGADPEPPSNEMEE